MTSEHGGLALSQLLPKTSSDVRGLKLVADKQGHPSAVVKLCEFDIPKQSDLSPSDILLEMILAPINFADLLNIRGYYGTTRSKYPLVGGNEGVFRVTAIGKDVKNFVVGDIACPILQDRVGTWITHKVVNADLCQRFCPDIDLVTASMFKVNLCTAFRMINDFTKLNKGDILIQSGGTSHVGQSVLQLCHRYGVHTINIVRHTCDNATLESLEKMGSDAIVKINGEEEPNINKILDQLKSNKWFDQNRVVLGLNCIGGYYFDVVEKILKDGSYLVTYGGVHKRSIEASIHSLIFRNIKFVGFSSGDWMKSKAGGVELSSMVDSISQMVTSGRYYRPPYTCFPLTNYKEAFEAFSARGSKGGLAPRLLFSRDLSFTQSLATLCKRIPK